MKGWKNLPPALLVMIVIDVLSSLVFVTYDLMHTATDSSVRIMLASAATTFTCYVLGAAGFRELAHRATGRVALGFAITAVGFALWVANLVFWQIFQSLEVHASFETIIAVRRWTYFGIGLVPLVGIAIAASAANVRAAIAAVVVVLLVDPLPPIARPLYGWMTHSWKGQMVLFEVLHSAGLITIIAIAMRLASPGAATQPREAAYGLRTVSSGLWLRVIAACSVAGLTLMFALGKGGEGAVSVLKLATFSSAIVGAISLAMIARGTLAARVADMPGELLAVAAAGALWCLGVTLAQLPYTYHLLYGSSEAGSGYGYGSETQRELVEALTIVAPLVAIVAIGLVARAIAGFAAHRGLEQLRAEAQGKGLGFVTLMVAALGAQQWLLPKAESESSAMFMLVAAAACSLLATVLMARLCTLAADSLQAEPGLPTATLQP